MGAEANARTRRILIDGVRKRAAEVLDQSVESEKEDNPFLEGAAAILDALRRGQIECRIYDKGKFNIATYRRPSEIKDMSPKKKRNIYGKFISKGMV